MNGQRAHALAAADGFRLAINLVKTRGKADSELIIPAGAVTTIKKLISEDTRMRVVDCDQNNATDEASRNTSSTISLSRNIWTVPILAQALDNTFPEYEKLAPQKPEEAHCGQHPPWSRRYGLWPPLKDKVPVRLQKKAGEDLSGQFPTRCRHQGPTAEWAS